MDIWAWGQLPIEVTHLPQEAPDAVGILRSEDVPQGSGLEACVPEPLLESAIQTILLHPQENLCRAKAGGYRGIEEGMASCTVPIQP